MSKKVQILKARAERMARAIESQEEIHHFIETLVFKLAQEFYAIETKYVKEVYPYKEYTPLPSTPPFILGIVNIRRKVFSIFDLKIFFGLSIEESKEKKLIILEGEEIEFALLADDIQGIERISLHDIQSSLPTLTGAKQEFVKGVTSKRIILLNGEKLLTSKQITVDETVEL